MFKETHRIQNFGDAFSPLAFEIATGLVPKWENSMRAEYLALGSIITSHLLENSEAAVWGSGMKTPVVWKGDSKLRVLAVRGRETQRFLGCTNAPLGDPGLLVSYLFPRTPKRRNHLVFIPHFSELNNVGSVSKLAAMRALGIKILLPSLPPSEIAHEISEAKAVVTSSLHGLVFAYALGVPAQLCLESVNEPLFKYRDFLGMFGETLKPISLDSVVADPRYVNRDIHYQEQEFLASNRKQRASQLAAELAFALSSDF